MIFVGAGASADLGLPAWKALSEDAVTEAAKEKGAKIDVYKHNLETRNYPEIFETLYSQWGEARVVDFLKRELLGSNRPVTPGSVDDLLASLPARLYLTTNFDGKIEAALASRGVYCQVLRNTPEDFSKVTSELKDAVIKLHGDLERPSSLVLNTTQYRKFKTAPEYLYFRQKLKTIFDQYPVLIVGYSITDPDIKLILEEIRETFHPSRPVYAFFPKLPPGEKEALHRDLNIFAITYSDDPDDHSHLKGALRTVARCCKTRGRTAAGARARYVLPADEPDKAAQLFLFTSFQLKGDALQFKLTSYQTLILNALWKLPGHSGGSAAIISTFPFDMDGQSDDSRSLIAAAIVQLEGQNLIKADANQIYRLTKDGENLASAGFADRDNVIKQFRGQAELDFVKMFPKAKADEVRVFSGAAMGCINDLFSARGLEIAGMILGRSDVDLKGASDILTVVKSKAEQLKKSEHAVFFHEYVLEILAAPTDAQLRYLSQVSQTYFAYHALNLDPKCRKFQKELVRERIFILDSHLLIALLAEGAFNHQYATELFGLIKSVGASCYTTKYLLDEVATHIKWAADFVRSNGTDSPQFLKAATGRSGYRQNLFIDGYIASATAHSKLRFENYIANILSGLTIQEFKRNPSAVIKDIKVFDPQTQFTGDELGKFEEASKQIEERRTQNGTFTRPDQCHAEAEILLITQSSENSARKFLLNEEKGATEIYFVSQGRILEQVKAVKERLTWTPEALYRYLLAFAGASARDDIWYQCLVSDLFQSGLNIVNEEVYEDFFGTQIRQAKLDYKEQRQYFSSVFDADVVKTLDAEFNETSDLDKPLFTQATSKRLLKLLERAASLSDEMKDKLKRYEEQERKRREFIRKQREKKRQP